MLELMRWSWHLIDALYHKLTQAMWRSERCYNAELNLMYCSHKLSMVASQLRGGTGHTPSPSTWQTPCLQHP